MQNPRAGTGGSPPPRPLPEPAAGRCQTPSLPIPIRCFISTGDSKAFPAARHGPVSPSTAVPTRPPGCSSLARGDGVRGAGGRCPGAALSPAASGAHTRHPRADTPARVAVAWLWLCWPNQRVCVGFPWQQGLGSPQPSQCNKVLSTGRVSVRAAGAPCRARSTAPRGSWGPWQGWTQALGKAREQGEWEQGAEWDPRSRDGATECGGCWGMAVKGSAEPSASPDTGGWLEQVSGALRPCGVAVGDGAVPKHHLGAKATRDGVGASTPASALRQP